jgi:hypothetical protein
MKPIQQSQARIYARVVDLDSFLQQNCFDSCKQLVDLFDGAASRKIALGEADKKLFRAAKARSVSCLRRAIGEPEQAIAFSRAKYTSMSRCLPLKK